MPLLKGHQSRISYHQQKRSSTFWPHLTCPFSSPTQLLTQSPPVTSTSCTYPTSIYDFLPCISPSPSLSCFQSNTKCPSRPVLGLLSPRNLFLTTPGLYSPQWQTYSVSIIIGISLLFNLDCYSWVHSCLTHNEPLSLCFISIIYIAWAIG